MSTQEFYIRQASEDEARGPFNVEQLSSLAENGQVAADTLYYEATTEEWVEIGANEELMDVLFPKKKVLKVKPKDKSQIQSINKTDPNDKPITVNEMLAAADGRTGDVNERIDPRILAARAASIGLYCNMAMLIITAGGFALSSFGEMQGVKLSTILGNPLSVVAVIDLAFAVMLFLKVTSIYPFLRIRAMLVFGYLATLGYLANDFKGIAVAAAASVGLYVCCTTTTVIYAILFGIIGILSSGGMAFMLIS